MKIGLCGAQGTGKTTLAKQYGAHANIPYLDAAVGSFLKAWGVNLSNDNMPVVERLQVQLLLAQHIDAITKQQAAATGSFITDRTPLDVLTYSRSIAASHYHDDLVMEQYAKIHIQCLETSNANFNLTMLLHPGVPLTEADHNREQRGSLAPFYVEHIDVLMTGLLMSFNRNLSDNSLSRYAMLKKDAISMERRIAALDSLVGSYIKSVTSDALPVH